MNILNVLKDIRQEMQKGTEESCQDVEEYNDIMNSEEAMHYGLPAKLQIWTDIAQEEEEVEVLSISPGKVTYRFRNTIHIVTVTIKSFLKYYKFSRTVY